MPPKGDKSSKKALEKEKKKQVEDKTFGLKNKNKSKKVEKYIKSVQGQVGLKKEDKRAMLLAQERKLEKQRAEEAKKELEKLFKPAVVQPKVPLGVDPKSVVCEFFKHGQCQKGAKCKFSHDLNVGRKAEKIDVYTDRRDTETAEDTIEQWDDEKLARVVDQKQTEANKNLKTKIVCKYFLDAIEQTKYGWFWECPNGGEKCPYVHALPPGFVLKKKKTEPEEEEEPTPIEEIIEEQRKLIATGTPVTLENFLKWKEEKKRKKEEARKAAEEKRLADIKAGKTIMSGREMFVFNPDVFVDDDEAFDSTTIADLGVDDGDRTPSPEPDNEGEYLGNDTDQTNGENNESDTTTTTTATSEGDQLAVDVNKNLFIAGDDDVPDIDDEDDEGED